VPTITWSFPSAALVFPDAHTWLPIYDSGVVGSAASVDAVFDAAVSSGTATSIGIYVVDYSTGADGPSLCFDADAFGTGINWPFSGSPCVGIAGATRIRVYVYPRGGGAFPKTLTVAASGHFTYTAPGTAYCVYGTRAKGGAPQAVLIGLETCALVAGLLAAPWLLVFLLPAVGLQLDVALLCAAQPPAAPPLANLDRWTTQDALQFIQAAIWNTWCECIPAMGGGTPPVSPPLPSANPPNSTGTPPVYTPTGCDGQDVCTTLNALSLQVGALQQAVAVFGSIIELVQREGVPFGMVPGSQHSGLSGSCAFDISGLVGCRVNVTAQPPYLTSDMENPPESFKFGDLTLAGQYGYLRKERLVKTPQLIYPIPGFATQITYDLEPGVTIDLLELSREP